MKEDWTIQMKKKLEGHQMMPPEGLWEGISNQMGLEPVPATKPTAIRRWHWAIAALVLTLVGFFVLYNLDKEQPTLEDTNGTLIVSRPISQKYDNQTIESEKQTSSDETRTSVKPKLLAMGTHQVSIKETSNQPVIQEQSETVDDGQSAHTTEVQTKPKQEQKAEIQSTKKTYLPDVTDTNQIGVFTETTSKWSVGLAGSNGLLIAANSMDSQPVPLDASSTDYSYNNGELAQPSPLVDVKSKHHIPLRLGISLQYQLNERLALLSGIGYTYLKSEFSYPQHHQYNKSQQLSYLGIPVGLSWKVWSANHVNLYLVGGTMLEKCIKAKSSKGELTPRPLQWSVNAAVGAEYSMTRQLGIYLEPSLGYYFDDGTKLEHYYKEHPLAPSLQFGLRLHLE